MIQACQESRLFVRFTAMLLVAAISVGTVLPLVWCFGGTDHSAIEFKVGGTTLKSIDDRSNSHPVQHTSISADDKYHPTDCVDRDAFPPALLAAKPEAPVIDWVDLPTPPAVDANCSVRNEATAWNSISPRAPISSAFPALGHLKTVILLI